MPELLYIIKTIMLKLSLPRPSWIIFFASALHWVWGCSLLFSPEPSRIAAWGSFENLPNPLLGILFMAIATLGYLGVYKRKSAWYLLPQQLMLMVTAISQACLMTAGHYADWVMRPFIFIFRDQVWGILLACFHLTAMLLIAHDNRKMYKPDFKCFIELPFETGAAIFTIINALLTFSPDSAVLVNLWQLIGGYSLIAVCYQLFSAISILYGMATKRFNVEIMGLILLCSVFSIRAIALLTDNDITISDLNSTALALTLIGCASARILTLINKVCLSRK